MRTEVTVSRTRGFMLPKQGVLHDWEDDPEFRRAVREAEAVGAMVPNVLDWAQHKAEQARDR